MKGIKVKTSGIWGVFGGYYDDSRIPRKLKKKVKRVCGIYWGGLSNSARKWYYLSQVNPEYHQSLISKVVQYERPI